MHKRLRLDQGDFDDRLERPLGVINKSGGPIGSRCPGCLVSTRSGGRVFGWPVADRRSPERLLHRDNAGLLCAGPAGDYAANTRIRLTRVADEATCCLALQQT